MMAAHGIRVRVNVAKMDRQILEIKSRNDAVVYTIQNAGTGQVLTSKRSPKKPWEKKAYHGTAVANFLRRLGVEPITYDDTVLADVESTLNASVAEAINDAWQTGDSQAHVLKDIFKLLAMDLADNARDRLYRGEVGTNTKQVRVKKERLAAAGYATTKGGPVPPYGIETGRFADGLEGIWKQGKQKRRRGVS